MNKLSFPDPGPAMPEQCVALSSELVPIDWRRLALGALERYVALVSMGVSVLNVEDDGRIIVRASKSSPAQLLDLQAALHKIDFRLHLYAEEKADDSLLRRRRADAVKVE